MSLAVLQIAAILENEKSQLAKYAEFCEEARKHFKRLPSGEVLISPDTFNNPAFDHVIESRTAKLLLNFEHRQNSLRAIVPRGWNDLSFVSRIRVETNCICRLELFCGGCLLRTWMLSKDSHIEEYCCFPLTGAQYSNIYFDCVFQNLHQSTIAKIQVMLLGVTFGNKNLHLHNAEWAKANALYDTDTIVGSFPCFTLKGGILSKSDYSYRCPQTDKLHELFKI